MSSDERSPKRQRTSYNSPQSPSHDTETTKHSPSQSQQHGGQPPHTPPPSVHMSPSWQSQQIQQTSNERGQMTFPTPPSTAGFQSQMMQQQGGSEAGGDSSAHTPMQGRQDGDGDAEMGGTSVPEGAGGDVKMQSSDTRHRRTDHERQAGEQEEVEEARDTVKPLPLYRLSTEPIAPLRPQPSENLLQLYDLTRIQGTVARRDEKGQKINKLRKSYQGKAKKLGLEGNLKASDGGRELWGLVHPGWDEVYPDGRTAFAVQHEETILGGSPPDDLLAKLDDAFSLAPGQLPNKENEQWKEYLNLDDSAKATPAANPANAKIVASNLFSKTAPGVDTRSSAPASPRNVAGRPERAGKKRRYDESSYSGYQEGYDDDGYSTGGDAGGRRGSGSKRQKRKDFAPSPTFNAGASGGGMVGIRSS